jgi:hypothetical protein
MLAVVIAIPYIRILKKDPSEALIGEKVGDIDSWIKDQEGFSINNIVSYPNHIFFTNDDEIYHLENQQIYPTYNTDSYTYRFNGTYFSSTKNFLVTKDSSAPAYDIDQQTNLYCWSDRQILVFNNTMLIEKIPLPEVNPDNLEEVNSLKVVNGFLIVFVSIQKEIPYEKDNSISRISNVSSRYYICDLSQKKKKFDKVLLDKTISSVDRSENEIAVLSMKGDVSIYFIQNKKLMLKKNWKIVNYPLFYSQSYIPILYTKNNNQMVLGEHSFLLPINESELKIIPLLNQNIVGVIKMSLYRGERMLMIRHDSKSKMYGLNELYSFKE